MRTQPLPALLLLACTGSAPGGAERDSGAPGGGGETEGEEGPSWDDTGSPVEEVPSAEALPVFSQDGGGFEGELSLEITSSSGRGKVWACLAPPDEEGCTMREVDEPLVLDDSIVVHAQVRTHAEDEAAEVLARAFFAVDDELEGWTSDLPVLVFWTDERLPAESDERVPVAMGVFEPDPESGRTALLGPATDSGRARLKPRGSSSLYFDKTNFDLELWQPGSDEDRQVALLGMPADGDWVLHAPYYYDDALLRNALAFATSNDVGRWAPRTRFVEVFGTERARGLRESDYLGVYTVIEEIERGADRVDVTPIGPEDTEAPEVTGGYVFKRDRPDDDDHSLDCGTAGGTIYYQYGIQLVDPEEHELVDAQLEYLQAECDAIGEASAAADFTDPASGRHYSEIIDVDSFVDHHILNVIFKNPDAFRLSGYLHKDREGLVQAGPLWDFDRACDSTDERAWYPTWWDASNQTTDTTYVFEDGWYALLMEDEDFALAYWTRWEELLEGELSAEAMDARIVAMAAELEEAAERNHDRWGGQDFSSEITSLRAWMAARHAWISACIATYEDPRACPG